MKALILVDIQNDFLPGGSLAITKSNEILPVIEGLLDLPFDLIIATKDWHPKDHLSFSANHQKVPGEKMRVGNVEQVLWPTHCVQGTVGAEFPPELGKAKISRVFYKGTSKDVDSYSAFFDNDHQHSTDLADYLFRHAITDLYIAGLATDYCVKFSVLDALKLGFSVFVVADGCCGVNLNPNDSNLALEEMKEAGAVLSTLNEVKKGF